MRMRSTTLPEIFHNAVLKWRDTYLNDYDFLIENWDRHFPRDPVFELCAYREQGMCEEIECGEMKGRPKYQRAAEMDPEQAGHLLGALKAQASTEFGSIQQHRNVLARAQEEEEQVWILRMMAEELRHGYQMLHLLMEDDWSVVSKESSAEMVEEILSMTTGSHILGAFNIDFDSFVDSVVFCALIDRVGKYQLEMQKISAYKPMAESMPPMLREEAFHLAAGVVPMRRFMQKAAQGEPYIAVETLQRTLNKWLPRGLEMFGDERGGGTNVRYGLKPMKNDEAQELYYQEVAKVVEDLNFRYVRARLPKLSRQEAEELIAKIHAEGTPQQGVGYEDLLHVPVKEFFRRRGMPAFEMIGTDGERFEDADTYLRYLTRHLPESYVTTLDFKDYADTLREVERGEITAAEALRRMPALRRVGGSCICSKAVRWVVDEPRPGSGASAPAS